MAMATMRRDTPLPGPGSPGAERRQEETQQAQPSPYPSSLFHGGLGCSRPFRPHGVCMCMWCCTCACGGCAYIVRHMLIDVQVAVTKDMPITFPLHLTHKVCFACILLHADARASSLGVVTKTTPKGFPAMAKQLAQQQQVNIWAYPYPYMLFVCIDKRSNILPSRGAKHQLSMAAQ